MGFPVTGIGGSAAPTIAKKPKSGCTVSEVGADRHRNGLGAFLLLALCALGRRRRRDR
jgi:MYXO-CTERM domain-containing protein